MAVLPVSGMDISSGVTFERYPSKTWGIDRNTMRISKEVDGIDAVKQAVDIILNVERFRWQIFKPYSGALWDGLLGNDSGYVSAELQRRIREALSMDDRIRGISDFSYSIDGDVLSASFRVDTVYGSFETHVGVNLA